PPSHPPCSLPDPPAPPCPAPNSCRRPPSPSRQPVPCEPPASCADERGNEGRALPVGMGRNRESEVRRQAFSDLRPCTPIRPTVVRASVVLLEERTVAGGVPREFVDTLPPLRIRVREKTRPHAAV